MIQKRVGKKVPLSRFKAVENCNYSIELAMANNMHMVGVSSSPFFISYVITDFAMNDRFKELI